MVHSADHLPAAPKSVDYLLDEQVNEEARAIVVTHHGQLLKANLWASAALLLALAGALWFYSDRAAVIFATTLLLGTTFASVALMRVANNSVSLDQKEKSHVCVQLLGGIAWGNLILVAMPFGIEARVFLALIVLATMATNAIESNGSFKTFLAFHCPFSLMAIAAFLLRSNNAVAYLATFTVAICAIYFAVLTRSRTSLGSEHARLSVRNSLLAERLKVANSDLEYRSSHDSLTDLPNRVAIQRFLDESTPDSNESHLAALYIDLDGFKAVNDTFGHDVGDHLLVAVGRRFQEVLPSKAMLGRWGGDEMIVIFPDYEDITRVESLADAILRTLEPEIAVRSQRLDVSASIGIATTLSGSVNTRDLLREADAALYAAKAAGRSCWVRSDGIDTNVRVQAQAHKAGDAELLPRA